jgi:hypothetical protein
MTGTRNHEIPSMAGKLALPHSKGLEKHLLLVKRKGKMSRVVGTVHGCLEASVTYRHNQKKLTHMQMKTKKEILTRWNSPTWGSVKLLGFGLELRALEILTEPTTWRLRVSRATDCASRAVVDERRLS